jgi:hypothetical protein
MVVFGDICPLFFNPIKDTFGVDSGYIQRWHTSDKIVIQVFQDTDDSQTIEANLINIATGEQQTLTLSTYTPSGSSIVMSYATITGLDDGIYQLSLEGILSEPFIVCSSDDLLDETMLIEYTNKDNDSIFNNIFYFNNQQVTFQFRVEAGFKPSGFLPHIENEQFRTQKQNIVELYAVPNNSYSLSVGNAGGVPYCYADLINKIFCLSDVYINGVAYVRSESNIPEMTQVSDDLQMFYLSLVLETKEKEVVRLTDNYIFTASTSYINFPAFAGNSYINVNSLLDGKLHGWTASSNDDWITVEKINENTISVSPTDNSGALRNGTVTLLQADSNKTITIDVRQLEVSYTLSASPAPIVVGNDGAFGVSSEITSIYNGTNEGWSASIDASIDWITLKNSSGNNGNSVTMDISPNTGGQERTAAFAITQDSGKSLTVFVVQHQILPIVFSTSQTIYQVGSPVSEFSSTPINSKDENGNPLYWTANTTDSWINIAFEGGDGETVTINAAGNTGENSRIGLIRLTQEETNRIILLNVIQEGTQPEDEYVFTASESDLSFNSSYNQDIWVDITSTKEGATHNWSVNGMSDWITAEKVSDGTLSVGVTDNAGALRNGTVTLLQADSNKTITINVTQGKAVTFSLNPESLSFNWNEYEGNGTARKSVTISDLASGEQIRVNYVNRGSVFNVYFAIYTSSTGSEKIQDKQLIGNGTYYINALNENYTTGDFTAAIDFEPVNDYSNIQRLSVQQNYDNS